MPERLPNAERAILDLRKLADYCLTRSIPAAAIRPASFGTRSAWDARTPPTCAFDCSEPSKPHMRRRWRITSGARAGGSTYCKGGSHVAIPTAVRRPRSRRRGPTMSLRDVLDAARRETRLSRRSYRPSDPERSVPGGYPGGSPRRGLVRRAVSDLPGRPPRHPHSRVRLQSSSPAAIF